jgi:hypothetical protein
MPDACIVDQHIKRAALLQAGSQAMDVDMHVFEFGVMLRPTITADVWDCLQKDLRPRHARRMSSMYMCCAVQCTLYVEVLEQQLHVLHAAEAGACLGL